MKRLLYFICLLMSVQIMSAQIITSSQVGRVEKVKKSKKVFEQVPLEKGYRGFVEAAFNANCEKMHGIGAGFDILTTHGYQINNWLYLGAGVGLIGTGQEGYYRYVVHDAQGHFISYWLDGSVMEKQGRGYKTMLFSIPLYANARFYVTNTKVKPFADIKVGGLISVGSKDLDFEYSTCHDEDCDGEEETYSQFTSQQKGIFFQLGLGLEYKWFDFSVNYAVKGRHISEYRTKNIAYASYNVIDLLNFTLNFGYNF